MIAGERFLNPQMIQEFDGLARVFARDQIGLMQSVQRSLADVA